MADGVATTDDANILTLFINVFQCPLQRPLVLLHASQSLTEILLYKTSSMICLGRVRKCHLRVVNWHQQVTTCACLSHATCVSPSEADKANNLGG